MGLPEASPARARQPARRGRARRCRGVPDDPRAAVLETSHPPSWYLPEDDWLPGPCAPPTEAACASGRAWPTTSTFGAVTGRQPARHGPTAPPPPSFAGGGGRGTVAVYPAAVDSCTVDGERVRPQAGGFYGGWVTSDVTGPFKGGPGSLRWEQLNLVKNA